MVFGKSWMALAGALWLSSVPCLAALDLESRLSALEAEVAQLKAQPKAEAPESLKFGLKSTLVYQQLLGQGGEGVDNGNRGAATANLDLVISAQPLTWVSFFSDMNVGGLQGIDSLVNANSPLNATWLSNEAEMVARQAYAQAKAGDWADLSLGLLDPTAFFDENNLANDETCSFLGGLFVWNPVLEPPTNGAGLLATTGAGPVRVKGMAVNAVDSSVDPAGNLFLALELAVSWTAPGPGGLRVWGRRIPSGDDEALTALGLSADQSFGSLGAFFRYGKERYVEKADHSAANKYDYTLSGGLTWSGVCLAAKEGSLQDSVGLAWGVDALQDGGREELLEARYCLPLGEHLMASLHYQALYSRLASQGALEPAHVLGSRVTLSY